MNLTLLAILITTMILLASCTSKPEAEDIVRTYYESLNNKDYKMMYWTISDGFKEIDPYAKDADTFAEYMSAFYETSSGVEVVKLHEMNNDGEKATIAYLIIITSKEGEKNNFSSSFTLKNQADGWKLIHPYGDNIDNS